MPDEVMLAGSPWRAKVRNPWAALRKAARRLAITSDAGVVSLWETPSSRMAQLEKPRAPNPLVSGS